MAVAAKLRQKVFLTMVQYAPAARDSESASALGATAMRAANMASLKSGEGITGSAVGWSKIETAAEGAAALEKRQLSLRRRGNAVVQ
jgi:hypothetical protein